MNLKTTAILLALLLTIAAVVWMTANKPATNVGVQPIFVLDHETFDWSTLKTIRLTRGGEVFAAELEGSQWWQTAPARFRMQTSLPASGGFDALVAGAQHELAVKIFTAADLPSGTETGLDDPEAIIELINDDESITTVEVGRIRPGAQGYVRIDDTVILGGIGFHELAAGSSWSSYRRHDLEASPIRRATQIQVIHPGGPPTLERRDGTWWVVEPHLGLADAAAVTVALDRVAATQIMGFPDDTPESPEDYGLLPPASSVRLSIPTAAGENRRTRLDIGRAADVGASAFFAQWSPDESDPRLAIIALAAETVEPWFAPADSWLDRRLRRTPSDQSVGLRWEPARPQDHTPGDEAVATEEPILPADGELLALDLYGTAPTALTESDVPVATATIDIAGGTTETIHLYLIENQWWFAHEGEAWRFKANLPEAPPMPVSE